MKASAPGATLALLLAACGGDRAGLEALDVSILAPLPGQETVVAYFTLANGGAGPVEITEVTSPEFASVEMHATIFGDGIAEMLMIDSITVAADSEVEFAMGGRHLMLMQPVASLVPGDEVTLEFHYGAAEPFRVHAPLEPRALGDR